MFLLILRCFKGNAERVAELQVHPRLHTDLAHNERIIAVGKGFDLRKKSCAYHHDADPNLAESVRVAASLIENLKTLLPETTQVFLPILFIKNPNRLSPSGRTI